jgi:hypothetical protein
MVDDEDETHLPYWESRCRSFSKLAENNALT